MVSLSRADRITGCLLAGALGDALGACFENAPAGTQFVIPAELQVTDDTQLTLATCEAIIEAGEVNPESIALHFLRWFRQRRITGIGASTLQALRGLEAGGHWALVGATGERSAGNGAAMRIAPLAFLLDPDDETQRRTIRDICRITHHHDEAYLGALAILRTIRYAIQDHPFTMEWLPTLVQSLPDSRIRDRLVEIRDLSPSIPEYASRFGASGFVADSVPLAILAALRCTDSLETLAQIIEAGGDTDTIGSLFGQIIGAAHGPDILPPDLLDRLEALPLIRKTVERFTHALPAW